MATLCKVYNHEIKFYDSEGNEIKGRVANAEHGIVVFDQPVAMVDFPVPVEWKMGEAA
jgi:hypothetical protein